MDKVFTDSTATEFYENIHGSMDHDVILIQSIAFANIRRQVMEKYFYITVCTMFPFSFYRSNARDTFEILRLKRKAIFSTGSPVGPSIVDESNYFFSESSCSESLRNLSERMWDKLSIQRCERMSQKRKRS